MRYLAIGFLALLAGCNNGSSGVSQQQIDTLQAKIDAFNASMTKAVADATHSESQQALALGKLQLIGNAHGVATAERTLAIGEAAATAVNFGPCTDMGVLVGFTSTPNAPADPLIATYQAFKQCTGYYYETTVGTGTLAVSPRLYFDGPNCSGNMYVWPASGSGYNAQTLEDGVVFSSPIDGSGLMVNAKQNSQIVQAQSAYIIQNGACEVDGDLQPMWIVTPNNISISGVPSTSIGNYQLTAP